MEIASLAIRSIVCPPEVDLGRGTRERTTLALEVQRSISGTRAGVDSSPVIIRVDVGVLEHKLVAIRRDESTEWKNELRDAH